MSQTAHHGDTETRRVFSVSPWQKRILLWLLPLSFLIVAFFFPLSHILALTFDLNTLTSSNLLLALHVLRFTFYQAILSTVLTLLLGLPSAFLFARYDFRGKSLLRALTAVPFMLPTVVVAAGFSALLGPRGLVHSLFPLLSFSFVGTLAAILIAHVFYNTTIIIRVVGNALSSLDPKLEDLPLAALLSVIQLLCTIIFSVIYSHFASRSTTQLAPRSTLTKPKTIKQKLFVTIFCFLLSVFFLLPLSSLPLRSLFRLEADRGQRGGVQYGFTTDYYTELCINRRGSVFYVPPIRATANSLGYAGATVLISLLLGIPAAFALAKPTGLERILDPLIMLPLGSSAVMLGLGFIISFGAWLTSPLLVPFAHTLVALPFVIRTLQPAIASIPQRLRQAASSLGASPLEVWKNIDLPILRRATLTAATFAFTISLGEFGATLLISRPEYPTIPIAIERFLSQPGGLNYGQAMAMATILMVLTMASILLIEKFRIPGSGEF